MNLLLNLILITSIWVLGLTIATDDGMILNPVRKALEDDKGNAKKGIYKPLILCHLCMPTFHTIVAYVFGRYVFHLFEWSWSVALMYPLVLMGSSITNAIVWQLYKLMQQAGYYYIKAEQVAHYESSDRRAAYNRNKKRQGDGTK